jgi:hypothetical protein
MTNNWHCCLLDITSRAAASAVAAGGGRVAPPALPPSLISLQQATDARLATLQQQLAARAAQVSLGGKAMHSVCFTLSAIHAFPISQCTCLTALISLTPPCCAGGGAAGAAAGGSAVDHGP